MIIKELREKVQASGGEIEYKNIVISLTSNDIDIKTKDGHLIAYVNDNLSDDDIVQDVSSVMIGAISHIDELNDFAQFIGLTVAKVEPITITKEVEKNDTEKHTLAGKVEAYEKILIGRELTVGR